MKVLIVGSGGREHALAWKIAQSSRVKKIYCAPGNGGIAGIAECVDIPADDIRALADFAEKQKIDLTMVGPEVPLSLGIVDLFAEKGLTVFGPGKSASRLESSKVFSKTIMKKYGVPTADFWVFSDYLEALKFVREANRPLVIKADGLCAGKGVFVCSSLAAQEQAIQALLKDGVFGDAGRTIMIEEKLEGEEASIIVISDGEHIVDMASSQDHKRIFDADEGPNTGGMGAYSPAPVVTDELFEQIKREVIMPVIRGMRCEGTPYRGVLYAGIMMTSAGPKVLEFNVRFGDPETQAIIPRFNGDLVEVLLKTIDGKLDTVKVDWDNRACVCVVMSSSGYPGSYAGGKTINGLDALSSRKNVVVFHAGTRKNNRAIVTAGGRVLGVTGLGATIREAITTAYDAVEKISFEGMHFRKDIGRRALERIAL
ncbi:MAG: phosphoribosylamine--glycine ligase [Candidatus Omnitrophica bacterium]|nr:phosphoribosylamine--glycine ligase [Candidatus Omnitrophota bacterium]